MEIIIKNNEGKDTFIIINKKEDIKNLLKWVKWKVENSL